MKTTFFALFLALQITAAQAQTIESYNGETLQENAQILYPKSMEEYAAIVQDSFKKGIPVRMVGRSHTTSGIILGEGLYVSTKYLNKIYGLTKKGDKVFLQVQPGVTLGQMDEFLSKNGLSLGLGFPMFRDLTVSGVVSTGSHGSSWTEKSMTAHYVGGMKVLNPYSGKWIYLDKSQNLGNFETDQTDMAILKNFTAEKTQMALDALTSNQALDAETVAFRRLLFRTSTVDLGSSLPKGDMEIEVTKQFNIRVTTQAADIDKMLLPNGKVNWNPNRIDGGTDDSLVVKFYFQAGKAIIEAGNKTLDAAMPGSQNVNFGTGDETQKAREATRDFMAHVHYNLEAGVKAEPLRVSGTLANPLFVAKNEAGLEVRMQDVVGPSETMTRARGDKLTWLFMPSDYSVSYPESKAYEILTAIQSFVLRTGYSFPFTGISCRPVTSDPSAAILSHVGKPGEPAGTKYVTMEFLEYRPLDLKGPNPEGARTALLAELIELLKSHDVVFHWAKNNTRILEPAYVRKSHGKSASVFERVISLVDSKGLLRNSLIKSIFPRANRCEALVKN